MKDLKYLMVFQERLIVEASHSCNVDQTNSRIDKSGYYLLKINYIILFVRGIVILYLFAIMYKISNVHVFASITGLIMYEK